MEGRGRKTEIFKLFLKFFLFYEIYIYIYIYLEVASR